MRIGNEQKKKKKIQESTLKKKFKSNLQTALEIANHQSKLYRSKNGIDANQLTKYRQNAEIR